LDRLNFLADEPWDEVDDDDRIRVRWFGHPFGACANLPGQPHDRYA